MGKIIPKLKRADWNAELFSSLHSLKRSFLHSFYTTIHSIEAKMMGVELGTNVNFNGHITINRFKHSKIKIGDNCTFNSHIAFNPRCNNRCVIATAKDFASIEIGNNCGFSGVSLDSYCKIKIGDNVTVGAETQIFDADGHADILGTEDEPVVIEDNVFIGMRCIIMKGVTIGKNSIIGAGSIVSKSIPPNSIAAGIPCRVLRSRE